MKYRQGFTIIEGLLIIVVVAILGTVGYLAYTNLVAPKSTSDASVSTKPVSVKNAKDLESVNKELEKLPVDDSELDQLDGAVNSF